MVLLGQHDLLRVEELIAEKHVLNGVSLDIGRGKIMALIGHNGAEKSTLLKAVFGLIPIWQGQVCLDGMALAWPNLAFAAVFDAMVRVVFPCWVSDLAILL
jgi:ABC-type branched-subunit amino acid transport system ATPase component